MSARSWVLVTVIALGSACGSTNERACIGESTDLASDPMNCGRCGNVCGDGFSCFAGVCRAGDCVPGDEEDCYTGRVGTQGVGPCQGGHRVCGEDGLWSRCDGEVVPVGEDGARCHDGIDNNCNGAVDEDEDRDGDGLTTCGGDCCDSTECDKPALVNFGAFDAPDNSVDDDCNGVVDDTKLLCDQDIASNTQDAMEYARAIDICQVATETDARWGVISAKLSLADGSGVPDPEGHSVRPRFGTNLHPRGGVSLAILSTGGAAAEHDVNPGFHPYTRLGYTHAGAQTSPFPADFVAANNGKLPNVATCPEPDGAIANDPVTLTLRISVPTNARSFRLASNFYSAEFPEYTCSEFNDFFVVLLDSTYAGEPANPADKNLAFYQETPTSMKVPVGVNLAFGDTGLFTQCVNGETGCESDHPGVISSCVGTGQLAGTGFDDADPQLCQLGAALGGATGWLVTSGNVTPGEVITLRIAVWDTSDHAWDSLAVIDAFQWSLDVATPGTVIF